MFCRPLRRLLEGLDAAGVGDAFALFVLSDTNDPAAAAAEQTRGRRVPGRRP